MIRHMRHARAHGYLSGWSPASTRTTTRLRFASQALLLLLAVTLFPFTTLPLAHASALSDLATSMQPGEWQALSTNNFGGGAITVTPENGTILEFTDEAQWDPIRKEYYIIGTARGTSGYGVINQKWLKYSASTNTWTDLTPHLPAGFYLGYHSYDHAAFDPARGHYYVRVISNKPANIVHRYDTNTGKWSLLPPMPPMQYSTVASGLEFFPEMDRLLFHNPGEHEFFIYDPNTDSWIRQYWGIDGAGYAIGSFTEHDPVNGVIYFGGATQGGSAASRTFFKIDRLGTVTRLAAPPVALGNNGSMKQHTVDPISGKFLVFETDGTIYQYDPASDAWRTAGTHPLAIRTNGQIAVTAKLPEYGVIMSVAFGGVGQNNSKVYLYKHSPGVGIPLPTDTTPPSAPGNLSLSDSSP